MIILDTTTRSLEIVLSAAITTNQLPVVVSYTDITSTGATPIANTTQSNSTTAVTIAAAPAASTQRIVKFLTVQNADSVSATLTVRYNDNSTMRTLWSGPLDVADTLEFVESIGFRVFDYKGNIKTVDTVLAAPPQILRPIGFDAQNLTATTTHTSNTSYAQYLGKAERPFTSVTARANVTTAAATITWAEWAIAKGGFTIAGAATLTTLGYTDVSAIVNSTGIKSVAISTSGMRAGDDLWLVFGAQATTMPVYRGGLADDLQSGYYQQLAATRPSTMAASTAFGVSSATQVPFWSYVQGRA